MTEIHIGGVPEHFNLPWHQAIESKAFEKENIRVKWKEYPGGTGAMCADLREGKLDLALVLTEGIIADIVKGNPSAIVQVFVTTPLIWGIHVPAHSDIDSIEKIKNKRYAISRMGSGSHLMAYVDAEIRGWELQKNQLVIVNNLEGARQAFQKKEAEIFLWEKFMTKPLVDAGEFRRVGERPTPWPCFLLAGNKESLKKHASIIPSIQSVSMKSCSQLKNNTRAVETIANRYGLKKEDTATWLASTQYAADNTVSKKMLEQVMNTLYGLGLIDKKVPVEDLCSGFVTLV
ncbi:MAG: ABC transporter substrate-binding protein [Cytophagaceae bacterium]|nr:ABC transporter substrate-binding protein [Cytophagaceae bacterium]